MPETKFPGNTDGPGLTSPKGSAGVASKSGWPKAGGMDHPGVVGPGSAPPLKDAGKD